MPLHFAKKHEDLSKFFLSKQEDFSGFSYFLKGDISGIQEYIFSVKSERASQTLKGRSFFIYVISLLIIDLIKNSLGENNIKVFYNGGGNFYILIRHFDKNEINSVRELIDNYCKDEEVYITISAISLEGLDIENDFGEAWELLNQKSNLDKLRKFHLSAEIFKPYQEVRLEDWPMFTRELTKSKGYTISKVTEGKKKIDYSGIIFLNYQFKLAGVSQFENTVIRLPKWTEGILNKHSDLISKEVDLRKAGTDDYTIPKSGNIIEFSYLADFAANRTGTDKLGVLKMDIDSLGEIFRKRERRQDAQKTSASLSWFFGDFINDFLATSFTYNVKNESGDKRTQLEPFSENIYPVFSGGDDCFFVGAWDAIFEFAWQLQKEFTAFSNYISNQIEGLAPITLSAGLIIVDPKFPVIRFAKEVEEALKKAKNTKDVSGKQVKNHISVFGEVLSWDEFDFAREKAHQIAELILFKNEPRRIIERIKQVASDYEHLQQKASQGNARGPMVGRLFYSMRNLKNLKDVEDWIKEYGTALLESFETGKKINYPKFPVAARWAEFLTR